MARACPCRHAQSGSARPALGTVVFADLGCGCNRLSRLATGHRGLIGTARALRLSHTNPASLLLDSGGKAELTVICSAHRPYSNIYVTIWPMLPRIRSTSCAASVSRPTARPASRVRSRPPQSPVCRSRCGAIPRRASAPRSPWLRRDHGRGSRCRQAR